jgi:hypothetical protein
MKITIFWNLLLILSLGACGAGNALKKTSMQDKSAIDEIVWRKSGPPMPPEFNKNFKVILSRTNQTLSIDSLRTAGIEVSRKLSTKDFDRILNLKSQYKIEIVGELSYDGCVGGEGETLTFSKEGQKIAEGTILDCGGKLRSNISGNLKGFTTAIRELAFGK